MKKYQYAMKHINNKGFLLQAVTRDKQMGLGHSEDVVDGSGCQDLPHGLIDDIWVLGGLHFHGSQETHDEELVQDGVWEHRKLHNILELFLMIIFSKGRKLFWNCKVCLCTFTVSRLHLSRLSKWVCPSFSKGDKETLALFKKVKEH